MCFNKNQNFLKSPLSQKGVPSADGGGFPNPILREARRESPVSGQAAATLFCERGLWLNFLPSSTY